MKNSKDSWPPGKGGERDHPEKSRNLRQNFQVEKKMLQGNQVLRENMKNMVQSL